MARESSSGNLEEDMHSMDVLVTTLRFDNEKLVGSVGTLEDKVSTCEGEIKQLKSYVVKVCETNNLLKNRLRELEVQSMKCNVLMLYAKEGENEKTLLMAIDLMKDDGMSIELSDFTGGRRLGVKREGKTRPILLTCYRVDVAQHLLQQYKKFSDRKKGIKVVPHMHNEYKENKSRLHTLAKSHKANGANVEVKHDHSMVNKQVVKDQVIPPSSQDVLFMTEEDKAKAADVRIVQPKTKVVDGSGFTLLVTPIKTLGDARVAYNAIASTPDVIQSSHVIMAYRLPNGNGTYRDDGDYGMGMQLYNCMENRGVSSTMCFLIRRYGGVHLGPKRFRIVLDLLDDAIKMIRINEDFKREYIWANDEAKPPQSKRIKTASGGGRSNHQKTHQTSFLNENIRDYMIPPQSPSSQETVDKSSIIEPAVLTLAS